MASLNLTGGDRWIDLMTGEACLPDTQNLSMAPYQALWLSNLDGEA
jgi:sucrose phosphorylase